MCVCVILMNSKYALKVSSLTHNVVSVQGSKVNVIVAMSPLSSLQSNLSDLYRITAASHVQPGSSAEPRFTIYNNLPKLFYRSSGHWTACPIAFSSLSLLLNDLSSSVTSDFHCRALCSLHQHAMSGLLCHNGAGRGDGARKERETWRRGYSCASRVLMETCLQETWKIYELFWSAETPS